MFSGGQIFSLFSKLNQIPKSLSLFFCFCRRTFSFSADPPSLLYIPECSSLLPNCLPPSHFWTWSLTVFPLFGYVIKAGLLVQKGAQRGNGRWEIQNNTLSLLLPVPSRAYLQVPVGAQGPNGWWEPKLRIQRKKGTVYGLPGLLEEETLSPGVHLDDSMMD